MNKIPIKIDLSIFFDDERRKVLLIFNPEWKTVECLQNRVETLFGLDPVRFLSDDGCFIPPQESIEVVKFCSDLKAFIHNDTLQKKKRKKERKTGCETIVENACNDVEVGSFQKQKSKQERKAKATISESESEAIVEEAYSNDVGADSLQKKRKYRSLESGFASSTPNSSKRIKEDVRLNATLVHHPQLAHKSSEISSTSEQMPPPLQPMLALSDFHSTVEKPKSKKRACRVSARTAVIKRNEEITGSKEDLQNEYSSSAVVEAKPTTEDDDVTTPPARPTSLPSSTLINESNTFKKKKRSASTNNPFKNSIPNTKHFYYDESGEITTTTTEKKEKDTETKILFHCALNDKDIKKPRIFQIPSSKLGPKTCDKAKIEIQESIVLCPLDVQNILNKSKIIEAPSQDDIDEEKPATLLHISPGNSMKEIEKTNLTSREAHSSADEGNRSLNYTNITASTAIVKYKETSMDVSIQANESNDDESSNVQMNQSNDDGVSMNQTSNSEENETSGVKDVNESSVASVDCVDLSVDLDDDDDDVCKSKSDRKRVKKSQQLSNYDSSDVEEVSEVIDLNETEETSNSSISFSKSKYSDIKLGKIMAFCTKMTQLPEIGDIVVFKVPYVSRKGPTCNTDFLAGEAQYINKRTKSIKILILDGHSELCYVPGKFFNNLDNSICGQKFLQIKSSDMIEPKILRKK